MRNVGKILLALFCGATIGCQASSPPPRPDAVMSGEETAKAAADAARAAEKDGKTGIINASSERAEATTQPTTQPSEPAEAEPTLNLSLVGDQLLVDGEPVSDFAKVAADAKAANPDVILSITSSEEVEHARIVELTDAAKAAGINRIKVKIEVQKEAPHGDASTADPDAPPPPQTPTPPAPQKDPNP